MAKWGLAGRLGITATGVALFGAQNSGHAQGMENVDSVATLSGTCAQLVVEDKDVTSRCRGAIVNAAYKSGRSSFMFVATDVAVASFNGRDTPAKSDDAMIEVDRITLSYLKGDKQPPMAIPATGVCVYSNPWVREAKVVCTATTERGTFSAIFVSDGTPPKTGS